MKNNRDSVSYWLWSVMGLIILMVCIGGITRLTGSGLSITEWKPIMGAIPPLSEHEWLSAFEKYKEIPQFKILNSDMTLSDFKFIFFWEFLHRLVGRCIGLVVFIPGLYFIFKKRWNKDFSSKVIFGFILGGLQGLLGWFMVKSGLSELVYVSHLRLAAHLMLALFILAYWRILYLRWNEQKQVAVAKLKEPLCKVWTSVLAIVLALQLTYGAFVAGLKAGIGYNTFPMMNGQWFPTEILSLSPLWINLFNNHAAVQFIHRWLAVVLVMVAVYGYVRFKAGRLLLGLLAVQFILGVLTLVLQVPLVLASLHQINACLLVLCVTDLKFSKSFLTVRANFSN